MTGVISKRNKLLILIGLGLYMLGLETFTGRFESYIKGFNGMPCIYDNWKIPFYPLIDKMISDSWLHSLIVIINSVCIDTAILCHGFVFIKEGIAGMPYVTCIFYFTRSFTLYFGGQWPKPVPFIFDYPGFPSLFISYAPANDCYFSGHIGICVLMMMFSWKNKHKKSAFFFLCLMLYTWVMLITTGAHYNNDVIIGTIWGIVSCVWVFKFEYTVTYYAMKYGFGFLHKIVEYVGEKLRVLKEVRFNDSKSSNKSSQNSLNC